ncbi:threonine ammonia-lyase [Natronolimnobius sp. AArcel1]|uniref:threonine ammonia-lyase n=1 Tax=Natronolimnobius sp. AArcel1 TaxID=1679093 RepID=UPI0013EDC287|nr:threonine ammonia-lyase [Natronolimnobius sp. AArcel1]NGM70637.1 threonine ammonia-lyase [Natronolimnobius sp. AArcel1]
MLSITAAQIRSVYDRFDDESIVQHTPVETSRSLSRLVDGDVILKMEHLQRTGSFKTRGAYNKMLSLEGGSDIDRVVAASAGNHAQGVALAANSRGVPSTIVMPATAPQSKVEATDEYGADVVLHGTTFRDAMAHARSLTDEGVEFVHAFDDPAIIAGQGTLGLELLEDVPDVDTVVVPIGGGGLIAGVGAALADHRPDIRVIGVQADSAATVPESLQKGMPESLEDVDTIADGIATGEVSDLTLELIDEHVDEIVTVTEEEIARGILLLLERAKQLVEGAGAASVAAILSDEVDVSGETVVPVLTGGNLDMTMLRAILTHELTSRSQMIRLQVRIDDQPGEMHTLSGLIADKGANIRTVNHYRADETLDVGEAYLVFLVETSGEEHAERITDAIEATGYAVERIN